MKGMLSCYFSTASFYPRCSSLACGLCSLCTSSRKGSGFSQVGFLLPSILPSHVLQEDTLHWLSQYCFFEKLPACFVSFLLSTHFPWEPAYLFSVCLAVCLIEVPWFYVVVLLLTLYMFFKLYIIACSLSPKLPSVFIIPVYLGSRY